MTIDTEPTEPWTSLTDLVALIQAFRNGDIEGQMVLMRHCDQPMVLAVAMSLLAQIADEHGATYPELLAWATIAVDRGV